MTEQSPPSWWCGLKSAPRRLQAGQSPSPPSWWCGLKCLPFCFARQHQGSPPSWWCGLKFFAYQKPYILLHVTTFVVVWIEMPSKRSQYVWYTVTTFVVVWIEICQKPNMQKPPTSPPSWWCGLKFKELKKSLETDESPPSWWCGLKSLF